MILRRNIEIIQELKSQIPFTPAEINSSVSFKTEIRRKIEFPYDEDYNFSYLLMDDGFYLLQDDGSKIIL